MTHLRTLVAAAPAKVNLLLRVLDRREDGFHELRTLLQAIDLWDRIEVRLTDGGVALEVVGPDLGPDPENLAFRAAQIVLEEANTPLGAKIRLEKHIPAGAGLGGGSSDAAAVLKAVNRLLGGPFPGRRLQELGATLGSDVPFFLGTSPLAVGRGRGEILESLEPLPPAVLLVVTPPVHVATGPAYAALGELRERAGHRPIASANEVVPPTGWGEVVAAARNDFEAVVPGLFPEVAVSLEALREVGAQMALLSGSGGACFGLFRDAGAAEAARRVLEDRLSWPVRLTKTLSAFPAMEVREPRQGG